MTFNTTQLGSFIGPIWQEISSLWSGVDFSFTDFLPESEQPSQTQLSSTVSDKALSESNRGRPEPCW
jgi:hypothetical protein